MPPGESPAFSISDFGGDTSSSPLLAIERAWSPDLVQRHANEGGSPSADYATVTTSGGTVTYDANEHTGTQSLRIVRTSNAQVGVRAPTLSGVQNTGDYGTSFAGSFFLFVNSLPSTSLNVEIFAASMNNADNVELTLNNLGELRIGRQNNPLVVSAASATLLGTGQWYEIHWAFDFTTQQNMRVLAWVNNDAPVELNWSDRYGWADIFVHARYGTMTAAVGASNYDLVFDDGTVFRTTPLNTGLLMRTTNETAAITPIEYDNVSTSGGTVAYSTAQFHEGTQSVRINRTSAAAVYAETLTFTRSVLGPGGRQHAALCGSFWMYVAARPSGVGDTTIFTVYHPVGSNLDISLSNTGLVRMRQQAGALSGGVQSAYSATAVPLNTWTQIVWTMDGTTGTFVGTVAVGSDAPQTVTWAQAAEVPPWLDYGCKTFTVASTYDIYFDDAYVYEGLVYPVTVAGPTTNPISVGGSIAPAGTHALNSARGTTQTGAVTPAGALSITKLAAFPTTPVLDDFNRADTGPPPSGNWTTNLSNIGHGLQVVGNQLANVSATGDQAEGYWSAASYGPDVDAYLTIANKPSSGTGNRSTTNDLYARVSNPGASVSAYGARYRYIDDGTDQATFSVLKYLSGAQTLLVTTARVTALAIGDKFGLRVFGSTIQVWAKRGAAAWTLITSATDPDVTAAGRVGLHSGITLYTGNLLWDDLGAGTYSAVVTTPITPTGTVTPAGVLKLTTGKLLAGTVTPAATLTEAETYRRTLTGTVTPAGTLTEAETYRRTLTGTITPAGVEARQTSRLFTGTTTPAGALAKSLPRAFAGTVTPAGVETRQTGKKPTGTITPAGVETRQWTRTLTGTITPTGAPARTTTKTPFTGTVTPTGAMVESETYPRAFAGTVTPAGTETRQTGKRATATINATGAVAVPATHPRSLAGTITPAGLVAVPATHPRTLTGTVTPAGALSANKVSGAVTNPISVGGTITPAGAETRSTGHAVAGTVTSSGALARGTIRALAVAGTVTSAGVEKRSMGKLVAGTLSPVGAVARNTSHSFAGTVTPAGAETRSTGHRMTGTVTPVGVETRSWARTLTGTLTFNGVVSRSLARRFTGTITPTATLAVPRTVVRALAGTVTPTATLARQTGKPLAGSVTPGTSALRWALTRTFAGLVTPAGAATKRWTPVVGKLSGTTTPAGAETRQTGKLLSGTVAPTASVTMLHQFSLILTAALAPASTLVKQTTHKFAGTISPAATLSAIRGFLVNVGGTIAPAAALARNTGKALSGLVAPAGAETRSITHKFAGTLTPAGVATKSLGRALVGSIAPAGVVRRSTGKPVTGAVAPVGNLFRSTGKPLTAALGTSGALARNTGKRMTGTITSSSVFVSSRAYLASLAGALTTIGNLRRSTGKALTGAATPTSIVIRKTSTRYTGSTTPTGVETRQTARRMTGSVSPAATVTTARAYLVALVGTLAPSAAVRRAMTKGLAGTVTPTGALLRQTTQKMSGALAPVGGLTRTTGKLLTATLHSTGTLASRKDAVLSVAGLLAPVGAIRRALTKAFSGLIAPASDVSVTAQAFVLPQGIPSTLTFGTPTVVAAVSRVDGVVAFVSDDEGQVLAGVGVDTGARAAPVATVGVGARAGVSVQTGASGMGTTVTVRRGGR